MDVLEVHVMGGRKETALLETTFAVAIGSGAGDLLCRQLRRNGVKIIAYHV